MSHITLCGEATFHPDIAWRIKDMHRRRLSWRSLKRTGLTEEQSFSITQLGYQGSSYFFLNGEGKHDWYTIQGDVLSFQTTVAYDEDMLVVLGKMLDACCIEWDYDIIPAEVKQYDNIN